jgi:hypothetical protein
MIDWESIETWNTGDTIDADTWTRRWVEPMSLLLRKPLTVVRRTSVQAVASGINYTNSISFDTIDLDDDGMVTTSSPFTQLFAQRAGVYDIFVSAPFVGNGENSQHILGVRIDINGTAMRERSCHIVSGASADMAKALDFSCKLDEGDEITVKVRNATSASINIQPYYNAPRLCVMWRGPQS